MEVGLWINDKMVYPDVGVGEMPNADMPEDVTGVYLEARTTATHSPRGAAALLRLAVQMLCKHLGGKGDNLYDDIGALVAQGLSVQVQQAFDSLRIYGNNAVHRGTIDLSDDLTTVSRLFKCLNIIVDQATTQRRMLQELADGIPQGQKDQIQKGDATNAKPNT